MRTKERGLSTHFAKIGYTSLSGVTKTEALRSTRQGSQSPCVAHAKGRW